MGILEITTTMIWIIVLFLVFLVASVGIFLYRRDLYVANREGIRKTYYLIVVVSSVVLGLTGDFPINTLPELIAFTVGVVALDLMLLQTPEITKFMSQEFKPQEEIVKTLHQSDEMLVELKDKILTVNRLMPKTKNPWTLSDFDFSYEKYDELLNQHLNNFTNSFKLDLYTYYVESSEEDDVFYKNIQSAYEKIRKDHGFSIRKVGMRKQNVIETLKDGENIEIIGNDSSSVLFPFFGNYHNTLLVVSSRQGASVTGADASLLLNLLYSMESWLVANEQELIGAFEEEYDDENADDYIEVASSEVSALRDEEDGNGSDPVI